MIERTRLKRQSAQQRRADPPSRAAHARGEVRPRAHELVQREHDRDLHRGETFRVRVEEDEHSHGAVGHGEEEVGDGDYDERPERGQRLRRAVQSPSPPPPRVVVAAVVVSTAAAAAPSPPSLAAAAGFAIEVRARRAVCARASPSSLRGGGADRPYSDNIPDEYSFRAESGLVATAVSVSRPLARLAAVLERARRSW